MNRIRVLTGIFVVASLAFAPVAAQQAAPPKAENPLSPLEWLVGKWTVDAVVPGSSASMKRESFFEWSNNRKALRFWSFVTPPGGQRAPYVEGWYFWDSVDKKIRFAYVDPGAYYEGEVKIEGAVLDHIFSGRHNNGSTSRWRYTLSNAGDGQMPTRIYSDKDGAWQEFVALTYQKQK